jgi:hypothetical protein
MLLWPGIDGIRCRRSGEFEGFACYLGLEITGLQDYCCALYYLLIAIAEGALVLSCNRLQNR